MRVATISDTHGNAVAFEAVIQDLRKQSPDVIVCLGDIAVRGPQPMECVQMVRDLNPAVIIRGNYDHLFTRFPKDGWKPKSEKEYKVQRAMNYDCEKLSREDQEWLANLEIKARVDFEGVPTELYHAAPDSLRKIVYPSVEEDTLHTQCEYENTKLVLYGHIHHAYARNSRGKLFVNGGSIGIPFDGDTRSGYAIVDIDGDDIAVQLRRVSYDCEKAIRIAKQLQMPDVEAFEYALTAGEYPYHMTFQKVNNKAKSTYT